MSDDQEWKHDWPEEFMPEMGDVLSVVVVTTRLDKIHDDSGDGHDFSTVTEIDVRAGDEETPPALALAIAISSLEGTVEELKKQFEKDFGQSADDAIRSETTKAGEAKVRYGDS